MPRITEDYTSSFLRKTLKKKKNIILNCNRIRSLLRAVLTHRWNIENSGKSQMVYFFLYFTEQAISTTFFLLHFALGNPVD